MTDNCIDGFTTNTYKQIGNSYAPLNNKQNFAYSTGVLNVIWQMWNGFWRTFWLANLMGGQDVNGMRISPNQLLRANCKNEAEAIFTVLFLLDKKKTPNGAISGSYQEPTWGDKRVIEKLGIKVLGTNSSIVTGLSAYGNTISHLQLVRNASVHLDRDNIAKLQTLVLPHYLLASIEYPTDILFAAELTSGKMAIRSWAENLRAFLLLSC
ncbi:hypothetical protein [Anaerospora sp.]|uniref:hypothetical protein n=1 Tax=Anaerospora sp. TaxID=1960278 RepID=UPI0028A08A22|nr:hypothetical protein [Anaerospora sp.]